MSRKRLAILAMTLTGCTTGVEEAKPKAENQGDQFVLQYKATIEGNPLYVLYDKQNDSIVYLAPGSGVYVQAKH